PPAAAPVVLMVVPVVSAPNMFLLAITASEPPFVDRVAPKTTSLVLVTTLVAVTIPVVLAIGEGPDVIVLSNHVGLGKLTEDPLTDPMTFTSPPDPVACKVTLPPYTEKFLKFEPVKPAPLKKLSILELMARDAPLNATVPFAPAAPPAPAPTVVPAAPTLPPA